MKEKQNLSRVFIIVFILFSAAIIAAGIFFYSVMINRTTEDKNSELSSIMQLKTNQIVEWRRERKSEANFFFNNDIFLERAENFFRKPSPNDTSVLNIWFSTIKENHSYRAIMLVNNAGEVVYRIGPEDPDIQDLEKINKTISLKAPWVDDLNIDPESGIIYLDTYTPLIRRDKGNEVFGILIFRIDPYNSLYPQLSSWPVKNKTAEANIVRREGDELLALNDLRFKDSTALRLRLPLTRTEMPAVQAINGKEGIIRGIDYRNVDVLTSVGRVPGTDWIIVTKIDESEVYESVYLNAALLGILLIALLAAGGTSLALVIRRKEYSAIEALYRKEQEKLALKEHYEHLIKHANDIILLMDYKGGIIDANEMAVSVYGYTREEFTSRNISELRSPEVRDVIRSLLDSNEEDRLIYESVHIKKNGEPFNVEISFGIIEVNNNKYIQNIIRDISERKSNESKIKKLNRVYTLISRVSTAIYKEKNAASLYQEICDIAVYSGNFKAAGIALLTEERGGFDIISSTGEEKTYFKEMFNALEKELNFQNPSINKDKAYIRNDIEDNIDLAGWRQEAVNRNIKSLGIFPLRTEEKSKGIIMFCSSEKNFFDDEENELLSELAYNINYAIQVQEIEKRRIATEEAFFKSEVNIRMIASSIPGTTVYLYDREMTVILAEGEESGFLISGRDARGRKINELLAGIIEYNAEFKSILNGREIRKEFSISDKQFSLFMRPAINSEGVIYAGVVVIQDISLRKSAESDLRRSESMLKAFYNLNNFYISLVELREDEIYFIRPNRRFAELYNKSVKEIKYKSLKELAGEEAHFYWIDIYRNVRKFKRPVSIEISFKREEKIVYLLAEITFLEQEELRNPLYSFTGMDITARKSEK